MKPTQKTGSSCQENPLSVVGKQDHEVMRAGFAEHVQSLLPMFEPIQNTRIVVDEPMHGAGRALVEQLLVSCPRAGSRRRQAP